MANYFVDSKPLRRSKRLIESALTKKNSGKPKSSIIEATPIKKDKKDYLTSLPLAVLVNEVYLPLCHFHNNGFRELTQTQIFPALYPPQSATLGLTCRAMYSIHFNLHGKMSLTATGPLSGDSYPYPLWARLENWMGCDFNYDGYKKIFVRRTEKHGGHRRTCCGAAL